MMTGIVLAGIAAVILFGLYVNRKQTPGRGNAIVGPAEPDPPEPPPPDGGYLADPQRWTETELRDLVQTISREESFRWPEVAAAICWVESRWNHRAVNPNDPSYGLMQLQFATAKAYVPIADPDDLFDPPTNARAGIRFLHDLDRKHYKDHGLAGVIQMYNLGETRFLKHGKRVPSYLAAVRSRLPREMVALYLQ